MKTKIKINCDCGISHEVNRDNEAPKTAISMGCNWCPKCEDTANEYYREWYNYTDDGDSNTNYGDDPKQLMMFSIADDILENHEPKKEPVILNCR
ncbi:hypothetical protein [Lutibacter flavus]|uniref:Uncharacterized protein n=1 Tax=Lutibacter flavus TaxID=691689 RepID=A0A238VKJ2_9FLAO|nr:hypothetical protein [Lutibacter flavus]SNR34694.1 hypothetical protein SAMN04488111_0625 [Lutibacter flavus]